MICTYHKLNYYYLLYLYYVLMLVVRTLEKKKRTNKSHKMYQDLSRYNIINNETMKCRFYFLLEQSYYQTISFVITKQLQLKIPLLL